MVSDMVLAFRAREKAICETLPKIPLQPIPTELGEYLYEPKFDSFAPILCPSWFTDEQRRRSMPTKDFPVSAYRIDVFCSVVGLSRSKIYAEISAGRLKAIKCGGRTLIPATYAQEWLDRLPRASIGK